MRKFRFLSLLLVIILLCGCAVQQPQTSESSDGTVASEFTEPVSSTDATSSSSDLEIFNKWKSNVASYAHMHYGFTNLDATDDAVASCQYTGGEFQIQIAVQLDGISSLGALLLLDGRPQPYRTAESEEYKYMYTFSPKDGDEEVYDIWFIPITGNVGDTLELTTIGLANPDYQITDGPQYGNHTTGCTGSTAYLHFQADALETSIVPGEDCILESSESTKDLTDKEFRKDFGSVQTSFPYIMSINQQQGSVGKSVGGDKYYNTDLSSPVQVDVEAWGDDDGKYGLVLYLNNEPINPEEPYYFQTEPGKKTIFHFTLDLSNAGEYPVIYGVIAARNYWENGLGTGADDFSYEIAPAYLTEAKDLWDLLGIQEITQD